jgi:hypothetical protein
MAILCTFFVDIDSDGIAVVLEHYLCMFGSFMFSNGMEMKEDDNNFAHFQKPHQIVVGLEWIVKGDMYKVLSRRVFSASQLFNITLNRVNFII